MIIGHRGAPGYRPEHTSASYELAYRQGVDWVDVDLVATSDGHLVVRHENEIGRSTDVRRHPEFADRLRSKVVDGAELTGWFTEDFTLAELKTLRVAERIPALRPNNTLYNGRYEILSYQEVLDLARRLSSELGRTLGTFPEVKHSAYFASLGLATEPALAEVLRGNQLGDRGAPVVIQAFEASSLRTLREYVDVPLLRLIPGHAPAELLTPDGLAEIARYADYLGPEKGLVIARDDAGNLAEATSLVADAHSAGLRVAPYTFRNENAFLPADLRSDDNSATWGKAFTEYERYRATGIDALFTDHPDTALEATRA